MEAPLTIAIPVFNRSRFFREALDSAIAQTVAVPILVVDNASDAFDFAQVIRSYSNPKISYVRNEANLGMVGNWNRCIELCKSEYLAILHDDDTLEPAFAESVLGEIKHNPAIVLCRNKFIDETGRVYRETSLARFQQNKDLSVWCFENPASAGIAFRSSVARNLGGFNEGIRYSPDFDLWFRLASVGGFQLIDDLLASYRLYSSPERITSGLEKNFEVIPRLRVQARRNFRFLRRNRPDLRVPEMCRPFLGFSELKKVAISLPSRRARYALALYVNSPSPSKIGAVSRFVMRHIGWAVVWWYRLLWRQS